MAELPDGTLVLNSRTFMRDGSKERLRTRAFSKDGGITWTRLENDPALKAVSCNGSLIALNHPKGLNNTVLLCSVPVGPKRTHGTVYASFDSGKTWPVRKVVVPGEFAYSSLVQLPDKAIGLFYETRGHRDIKLIKFDLESICKARVQTTEETTIDSTSKPSRPNFLFILVDDLGWSDLGCYGSKTYETPNVDRLAAEGMVFTDFYAAAPVCSPTRTSILTGKYPARSGLTTYLLSPERDPGHVAHHLELDEFTLAEALKENGYATGYFGKWHLGYAMEHWADKQGFDVAKGGMDLPWAWQACFPDR